MAFAPEDSSAVRRNAAFMPELPEGSTLNRRPRPAAMTDRTPAKPRTAPPDDRFFRHIVSSMRNGVIAVHRDGTLALMNDEAYRIFGITRRAGDIGRSFRDVLHDRPAILRVLAGSFELTHLPNRAELRLKELDRVIGYTLLQ